MFLQEQRDGKAAKRFFKCLLRNHHDEPRKIVTDKLRSYGVAHREIIPDTIHDMAQYANNRAKLRISRHGFESGVCAALNRCSKPNAYLTYMLRV